MTEDDKTGISHLIEKELTSSDKILKPDFNQKTGRELLAFYLQSKFKQVLAYDNKAAEPIFIEVRYDFIQKFSRRLIQNPNKRIMIGITGESASGKSTICREIENVIKRFNMPVTILTTDNYFNDISELIKKYGTFDNLRDNGYDVDSPKFTKEELKKFVLYHKEYFDITPKKVLISFKIEAHIIAIMKATGKGYQTRMNKCLREAVIEGRF